MAEKLKKTKNW